MKSRVILPLLCCLLVISLGVGMANASPELEVDGSDITIDGGVTDAMLAEIKKVNIGEANFSLKNINDVADLEKLCGAFSDITSLDVEGGGGLTSIAPMAGLKKLSSTTIEAHSVADFSPLSGLTELKFLSIRSEAMGPDLKWMSGLNKLSKVDISAGKELVSFEGLPATPTVKKAEFNDVESQDITPLTALSGLERLELSGTDIPDFAPLAKLAKLKTLVIHDSKVTDFSPLAACPALREVQFGSLEKGTDYSTLSKLTQITSLSCTASRGIDITWIATMTNLKKLTIFNDIIEDLAPLASLRPEELTIWQMTKPVGDLGFLSGMTSLKKLELINLEGVSNLGALKNLTALTTLTLEGINKKGGEPVTVEPVKTLPNLTRLSVDKKAVPEDALTGFANPKIRINRK